jgi:hypothetical protein
MLERTEHALELNPRHPAPSLSHNSRYNPLKILKPFFFKISYFLSKYLKNKNKKKYQISSFLILDSLESLK